MRLLVALVAWIAAAGPLFELRANSQTGLQLIRG
jgi:hypothetical protein